MPPAYLLGIISAIYALLLVVVGFIVKDLLNGLRERIRILEAANNAAVLLSRIDTHEKDLEGLRKWKHLVIDPYVPGAIDALKDRTDRLDRKVFNGDKR